MQQQPAGVAGVRVSIVDIEDYKAQKGSRMPPDKSGEGKRKLPEPKEAMETPDKKIPVPTGSSGSSARRILFSEMHQKPEECTGTDEMEEVQSKSRFCSERDVQSNAACAPGSGTHRQRARVLFGRMPGRERMNRFFESTEQQVRFGIFTCSAFGILRQATETRWAQMYIM